MLCLMFNVLFVQLKVGLDDLGGISQLQWFYGSVTPSV